MSNAAKKILPAVLFLLALIFALGSSAGATDFHIYSDTANARADIAHAIHEATLQHKRILLEFGGNWCGDCEVLNIYFHQEPNLSLLEKNFLLVHVDVGHFEKNLDIAEKYQVSLKHGVPVMAVLDAHGRLIFSHKNGGFDAQVRTDPNAVTRFLNEWKPKR